MVGRSIAGSVYRFLGFFLTLFILEAVRLVCVGSGRYSGGLCLGLDYFRR